MEKKHKSCDQVARKSGKTDKKAKWVNKLNIIVLLCKNIFSRVHCFGISIRQTVPQFNINLMTQFNKGKTL